MGGYVPPEVGRMVAEGLRGAWRTMESAPKDGAAVLLWVTYPWENPPAPAAVTASWAQPGGRPGPKEYWALLETGGYAEDDEVCGTPTHWMPLPEPPR